MENLGVTDVVVFILILVQKNSLFLLITRGEARGLPGRVTWSLGRFRQKSNCSLQPELGSQLSWLDCYMRPFWRCSCAVCFLKNSLHVGQAACFWLSLAPGRMGLKISCTGRWLLPLSYQAKPKSQVSIDENSKEMSRRHSFGASAGIQPCRHLGRLMILPYLPFYQSTINLHTDVRVFSWSLII